MDDYFKEQLQLINQQLKEIAALYRYAARKYGITEKEFWVLYGILNLKGDYSQQDLCDLWFLPKQTINSVISNLRSKGYVYLENVPGSRNKKTIKLTELGHKFGEDTVSLIYEAERKAISNFSKQELETLINLTTKYITFLRKEIYKKDEPV